MMGFRYFLPRPIKKFSLKNEDKTERRKWSCLIDENTHVHLHMSFIHTLPFFTFFDFFFFPSSYMLPPLFILSFFLLFFWTLPFLSFFFSFDLLGWHPVYVAHIFFSFAFLCVCVFVFVLDFLFRCDFFFPGHDFYFLINLGDCFFFFNWA